MVLRVRVAHDPVALTRSKEQSASKRIPTPYHHTLTDTALQVIRWNWGDFAGCSMLKVNSLGDSCPAGT